MLLSGHLRSFLCLIVALSLCSCNREPRANVDSFEFLEAFSEVRSELGTFVQGPSMKFLRENQENLLLLENGNVLIRGGRRATIGYYAEIGPEVYSPSENAILAADPNVHSNKFLRQPDHNSLSATLQANGARRRLLTLGKGLQLAIDESITHERNTDKPTYKTELFVVDPNSGSSRFAASTEAKLGPAIVLHDGSIFFSTVSYWSYDKGEYSAIRPTAIFRFK